jgi:hypothetical protein
MRARSCDSRMDVKHERIHVGPELGDDERHFLRHQAADERHVTRQPVELGNNHRRRLAAPAIAKLARSLDGGRHLWPTLKRIGTFPVSTSLNVSAMR